MSESFEERYRRWERETLEPALRVHPERTADFKTTSDIPIQRVFLPDPPGRTYFSKLGLPGAPPYTRGVHASMYRSRLWTMRQYAGYATATESNARYRYLLSQGQTGLSIAFDLPTQIGYDADHPLSNGEVGKVGVSVSCLEDMQQLLDQIPLDRVSTSMTINAPAAILLAMVIAVAHRQDVSSEALRGTIQNDILKEYIARGTYIFPPGPAMRLITDTFKYCRESVPQWNPISISGYHIREAGASAVQELAFTMANAIAYVESALAAGLSIDAFAPRLAFFFSVDNNLLEEVAKFRAARRLWARIVMERFHAQDSLSARLRFHAQTGGSTLTAQQPENNVVRVTLQALAAVLGGTQSLHTNSMDEALGLPTEHAVNVALRTQQIIAYESGVTDTVDPLGGAYAIEELTDELETRAQTYLDEIEALGGALKAIETGYVQRHIQDSAYQAQRAIERGDSVVVGVNRFEEGAGQRIEQLRVDPAIEAAQRDHLQGLRDRRDQARVNDLLAELGEAAGTEANLMPIFIRCVEADVTLGEICERLRDIWGEYEPPLTV